MSLNSVGYLKIVNVGHDLVLGPDSELIGLFLAFLAFIAKIIIRCAIAYFHINSDT